MIMNKNILAILRAFWNLEKKLWKTLTKQTSTAATNEFFNKFPNRKKISNERFNLCFIKSINSQTNNKSADNDDLTTEFYVWNV